MADFDLTRLALKMVCPSNELLTDDKGLPGVYVQRTPRRLNELLTAGDNSIHPAFLVNSVEITRLLFGKFQGKAHTNRIYSLPGEDPPTSINLDTYEAYCKNKGDGHHCITAAEWAFLALCAKKDGRMPKGNNNYGKDISETTYVAIPAHGVQDGGKTARTLTGTGPLTWSDTGDITGIFDLNGNIWEWTAGVRLVKGELQVIPYNDAASPDCNTAADSNRWKAINAAATGYADLFVTPNGQGTTAGTIKLDWVSEHWQWGVTIATQEDSPKYATFAATTYAAGLSAFCKMFLQAMAFGPEEGAAADDYAGDGFWANNGAAERCAVRGGGWDGGASAGVFYLNFDHPRSHVGWYLGGRPAFYE